MLGVWPGITQGGRVLGMRGQGLGVPVGSLEKGSVALTRDDCTHRGHMGLTTLPCFFLIFFTQFAVTISSSWAGCNIQERSTRGGEECKGGEQSLEPLLVHILIMSNLYALCTRRNAYDECMR